MPMTPASKLKIGVAGWSYDDWRDAVYRIPVATSQPDLFKPPSSDISYEYPDDELAYLARYVDMIEVNSSFYRIPARRAVATWSKRVDFKPEFFFTAKLNHQFTHDFAQDTKLAGEFLTAFEPLREAGCLDALLAQFRYDFADSVASRKHLEWIRSEFGEVPLVVELRHRSWQETSAVRFLDGLGVTVANLDYPAARDSFTAELPVTSGERGYLRLHGRNRTAWFSSDVPPYETYNYDYSDAEIGGIAERSRGIMKNVKQLTIVANNHYRGKAVSAALRLKSEMQDQKLPVPPALLETYPQLQAIAKK